MSLAWVFKMLLRLSVLITSLDARTILVFSLLLNIRGATRNHLCGSTKTMKKFAVCVELREAPDEHET
jgi:hypothetical protein